MLPQIPVRFVFLGSDEIESPDSQFEAVCVSVPKIGEQVTPQAGSQKVRVANVYHNFIPNPEMGEGFYQYITVVLKDR
jgi:hypothetical protein